MPLSIQDFKTQNPDYSDVPDQELADRLHTKFYSDMPKEDFYQKVGITKPEGTLARIGKDETKDVVQAGSELANAASDSFKPDKSAGPGWLQRIGQAGGAIGNFLSSPFKNVAKETVGEAGANAVTKLALNAAKEDHPELTQNITPQDEQNIVNKAHETSKDVIGSSVAGATMATIGTDAQIGGFKSIKDIRAAISNKVAQPDSGGFLTNNQSGAYITPKETPEGFDVLAQANKGTGLLAKGEDPSVSGLKANQRLSQAYDNNNAKATQLYTAQKALGEGETTQANEIAQPLSKTITDLENSAITPQQASTLRRLKAIQEKYFTAPDTGETASGMSVAGEAVTPKAQSIELNDLVELKQALNEGFKSNDFTKSSDIPLVQLNNAIRDKIASLDNSHPEFVQAGKVADTYYANEVARKFKDNSQLEPFWQAEDYHAWKELQSNPSARGVSDATVTRAGKFLDSLNSGDEGRVTAVINALPKEQAIQVLHDAILQAKSVTPSLRNVALNLIGRTGTTGTVGTPIYSMEQALRNLVGAFNPSQKAAPLVDLANRATPPSPSFVKPAGVAGLSYLAGKSFFNNKQKQKDDNGKPQSNNSPVGATNAALTQSKKNDSFQLSDLNPISEAEASTIKPSDTKVGSNVANFLNTSHGQALQRAVKNQGQSANEIMTMVNTESSVNPNNKDYGQMTSGAWKQSEKLLGRKLNRHNDDDYANAVVSYYKWTADQVKQVNGSGGTPAVRDVYIAYNAGIGGYKALMNAKPSDIAANVVGSNTAQNNKSFYYTADGTPLTVARTISKYHATIDSKMNEYAPINNKQATQMALAKSAAPRPQPQARVNYKPQQVSYRGTKMEKLF